MLSPFVHNLRGSACRRQRNQMLAPIASNHGAPRSPIGTVQAESLTHSSTSTDVSMGRRRRRQLQYRKSMQATCGSACFVRFIQPIRSINAHPDLPFLTACVLFMPDQTFLQSLTGTRLVFVALMSCQVRATALFVDQALVTQQEMASLMRPI